ncbi:MAG: hypothetical protein RR231_09235 [Acinetobacter sp.]
MNKESILHGYVCAELGRTGVYPSKSTIDRLEKHADKFIADYCKTIVIVDDKKSSSSICEAIKNNIKTIP